MIWSPICGAWEARNENTNCATLRERRFCTSPVSANCRRGQQSFHLGHLLRELPGAALLSTGPDQPTERRPIETNLGLPDAKPRHCRDFADRIRRGYVHPPTT